MLSQSAFVTFIKIGLHLIMYWQSGTYLHKLGLLTFVKESLELAFTSDASIRTSNIRKLSSVFVTSTVPFVD